MSPLDLNIKKAHANAKKTLNSHFYWSDTDLGYDAVEIFKDAKNNDKTTSPISFIKEYFEKWGYDNFNLYETDFKIIEEFNEQKNGSDQYFQSYECYEDIKKEMEEEAEGMGYDIFEWEASFAANFENNSMDAASIRVDDFIIGVCFFQFYLDGFISEELRELTKIALDRECDFNSICKFPHELRDSRLKELTVLQADLLKMEAYIK